MSEFRQNIVTQEWVIIAPERGKKPKALKKDETEQNLLSEYDRDCPFCPGNEKKFEVIETFGLRDKKGRWKVRFYKE